MVKMFDMPPRPDGSDRDRLTQLYRYLISLSGQLNEAMNGLEGATGSAAEQEQKLKDIIERASREVRSAQQAMRSMILKSAEDMQAEMDRIGQEMLERYSMDSERFGMIEDELRKAITEAAGDIEQNRMNGDSIREESEGYGGFIRRIAERIFCGTIGTDTGGKPVGGIAIGENITAYDSGGNPVINDSGKAVTITRDRVSFWQGTKELAYFSGRKLHITGGVEIGGGARAGAYEWKAMADGSAGMEYIG